MKKDYLAGIIERELNGLKDQLNAYENEADMWELPDGISNSAGNLAMHLVGNLRHFIGVQLGGSNYVRNRKHEFTGRHVPRADILGSIDEAIAEVPHVIRKLDDAMLETEYPLELAGVRFNCGDFILHLLSHLAYHLGQVDYHRRIVTGENKTAGSIAIPKLLSAKK